MYILSYVHKLPYGKGKGSNGVSGLLLHTVLLKGASRGGALIEPTRSDFMNTIVYGKGSCNFSRRSHPSEFLCPSRDEYFRVLKKFRSEFPKEERAGKNKDHCRVAPYLFSCFWLFKHSVVIIITLNINYTPFLNFHKEDGCMLFF